MDFFSKKNLNFFKIAKCGKLFVECVSIGIISLQCLFTSIGFLVKIKKKFKLGKLENMKTEYFVKKTLSSFKKASLPKWDGAKYAGGSQPSCLDYYCHQSKVNIGRQGIHTAFHRFLVK